jgi:hypothetical protein
MRLFRNKAAAAKADDDVGTMNTEDRARGRSRTTRPKNLDTRMDEDPPMIGRVPTAMGYHSDDSVDDMAEERSEYSRYDIGRKEPRQNPKLELEDEEDSVDHDDRYSHYGTPTVERTRSDSSDSCPPQWKSWSNDEEDQIGLDGEVEPNLDGGDASMKNKKAKEETAVAEKDKKVEEQAAVEEKDVMEEGSVAQDFIPAVPSDTSSLTDPLSREALLTKAYKTQQKVAAQSAKKTKKVKPEKALVASKENNYETRARLTADIVDRLINEEKTSTKDRRKSKGMTSTKARRNSKKNAPKKGYFQRRRKAEDKDSKRESSTPKDSKKKAKGVDNFDDVSTIDAKAMTSEDKRNMYSKSLLTDESNVHTKEVDEDYDYVQDEDEEDDDFEQLPYVNSLRIKRKSTPIEKARKAAVVELDEYSVEAYSNGYDDPQLVQCLKFYSCGLAAAAIEVGINTATCRRPPTIGEEIPMDEIEALRINDENKILSPRPNVEVVLEGYRLDAPREGRQDDEESTLVEAPNIQLPHTRSYVKEVTSLHLQLDELWDEKQSPAGMRQLNNDDSEEWDMPITTIDVPVRIEDASQNDDSDASAESGTVIVIKPAKRGIRGMFSRFRKQKELITTRTSLTAEEASNGPIEMAME